MTLFKNDIDEEWSNFISNREGEGDFLEKEQSQIEVTDVLQSNVDFNIPTAQALHISTKSKISYLNKEIDLKTVFWKIDVIPYHCPVNGVVKKQMKFNSLLEHELADIKNHLKNETYYEEQIITNINNPTGRIKFKDIRKVSVGICKKDITSCRCKKKSAFYNCFVLILRLKENCIFKEYHVKIFNTGKMEIPGVQNDASYQEILNKVKEILKPILEDDTLDYSKTNETVLINSNFNCGFYICRETLFDILKNKYDIQCIFDPCSYPGIQCKFYYNPEEAKNGVMQNGCRNSKKSENINSHIEKEKINDIVNVSFMIFRTGNILIVGKCNDDILYIIYEFLKKLLIQEHPNICQKVNENENETNIIQKGKNKKIRRKTIFTDSNV